MATVEQYKIEVPGFHNPADVVDMLRNKHFSTVIMACWKIYNFKGNDYTRGKGDLDRTDNFKMAAENNGVTALQAWGVYFYKHVSAVWRFLKDGKVESEPIEGRIYDVINYAILLALLVKEMRGEADA
jgi:hypothetical protein